MGKVRWGVLGTASIALNKVIPALKRSEHCDVVALASRQLPRAVTASESLSIAKAYGAYEQLLADPDVEAVYIPLPNHLHVPWSLKALAAGKHVLCEKPIALDAGEAEELLTASRRFPRLKLMEAFMYRHHPQWVRARQLIEQGAIGELKTVHSFFSYFNENPDDIRNQPALGGGGLMDIGCYPVSLSRWLFQRQPWRVIASVEYDRRFRVDQLTSALMDFGDASATFTCSTQLVPHQRVAVYGTTGRIEIEIPFNAPPDRPCRMWVETPAGSEQVLLDVCDQYTVQGDLFSRAIRDDAPVPTPPEDAVGNMRVIDALFRSARNGNWEMP